MGGGTTFPYQRILTNESRTNEGNAKSPSGPQESNNCRRQDPLRMKYQWTKVWEEIGHFHSLEVFPSKYLSGTEW